MHLHIPCQQVQIIPLHDPGDGWSEVAIAPHLYTADWYRKACPKTPIIPECPHVSMPQTQKTSVLSFVICHNETSLD